MLRVNKKDVNIRKWLVKASSDLFRIYPESTIYCSLTANVILFAPKEKTWEIFFGQNFSPDSQKEIRYGQYEEGRVEGKFFTLNAPLDVVKIPTTFPVEHFNEIFQRTFFSSNVIVHSIVNLVFKFQKGIEKFDSSESLYAQRWTKLF